MASIKRRIQEAFNKETCVYLVCVKGNDQVVVYPGILIRIAETKTEHGKTTNYIIKHIRRGNINTEKFNAFVLCLTHAAAAKAVKMLLEQISGNKI